MLTSKSSSQQYRDAYARLHDFVSDCIEGGRINETDLPDDYQALVEACVDCVAADHRLTEALQGGMFMVVTPDERQQIANLMRTAADRCDDTLANPLESCRTPREQLDGLELLRSQAKHWQEIFERR